MYKYISTLALSLLIASSAFGQQSADSLRKLLQTVCYANTEGKITCEHKLLNVSVQVAGYSARPVKISKMDTTILYGKVAYVIFLEFDKIFGEEGSAASTNSSLVLVDSATKRGMGDILFLIPTGESGIAGHAWLSDATQIDPWSIQNGVVSLQVMQHVTYFISEKK